MGSLKIFTSSQRQSGQTAIEYILLLMIVVVIILGAVYQFNGAFKSYARNYFGDYLACLIESGELPNLGAASATSQCDESFVRFSLANGRPPQELGDSASGSRGDGRDDSPSSKNKDAAGAKSPGQASGGSADGRTNPSRFSGGSLSGNVNSLRPSNQVVGEGDAGTDKNGEGGSKRRFVSRRGGTFSSSDRVDSFEGSGRQSYFKASKIEEEQQNGRGVSEQKKFTEDPQMIRNKSFTIDKNGRRVASEPEEEVTFPNLLRYLIIIALLIALFLLLSGQFSSISKSMDKN